MKETRIFYALNIIGWVTAIAGSMAGLLIGTAGNLPEGYAYILKPPPVCWIYGGTLVLFSVVSGIILLSFARFIILLTRIVEKLPTSANGGSGTHSVHSVVESQDSKPGNEEVLRKNARDQGCSFFNLYLPRSRITGYYKKQHKPVEKVIPTPYQGFFYVKTAGNYELVVIRLFSPKVVAEEKIKAIKEWRKENRELFA